MNCDKLASWYRWAEYLGFGHELERRREQFLPAMCTGRRALVLGDGDGRFLAALLKMNPAVEVDAVDNSAGMLALARNRVAANGNNGVGRVHFHHADARDWPLPPGARYDLIVTHFFLDCFAAEELQPLVERLAFSATESACWVVSEFHRPEQGLAAWRARLWIGALYRLFGVMTGLRVRNLPGYQPLLEGCGFRRKQVVLSSAGLLISEWWQRS